MGEGAGAKKRAVREGGRLDLELSFFYVHITSFLFFFKLPNDYLERIHDFPLTHGMNSFICVLLPEF